MRGSLLAGRIHQLNVEGLSAAERSIIRDIAERHINIDAICFQALTKFEGGLNLLHEANDDAVILLGSTATAALAK